MGSEDKLRRLAEKVDEQFAEYRDPGSFKDVSIVIDNVDRPTLIVHVTSEELADEVESFLQSQGARTEREFYGEDDIRVLAVGE